MVFLELTSFDRTFPVPITPAADVRQLVISLSVSHYRALTLTLALYFLSISQRDPGHRIIRSVLRLEQMEEVDIATGVK